MLQTLFYIPREIGGYPLFGFGVLLAVWAVASVALMAWLVWRHGLSADTLGYLPILLIMGAVVAWLLPALSEEQGLPVHGYGVMMFLAVTSATALAVRRGKQVGLNADIIFSLAFWMIIPGIVGARAFYVREYWWRDYWPLYTDPHGGLGALIGGVLNVAKGGLVVYGAFIGGVVGLVSFVRKYRLPLLAVCDLAAPSMMLGLALGRVGCLLNGCCFGAVCEHAWAVTFPPEAPPYLAQASRGQMYGFTLSNDPKQPAWVKAVAPGSPAERAGLKVGDRVRSINGVALPAEEDKNPIADAVQSQRQLDVAVEGRGTITIRAIKRPQRSLPVHPTQLYSTIDALLLCLLLLAYSPFRRREGELFALMMSIYPVTRFLIEGLRSDEPPVFGTGLSISQNVSLLMLVFAAALWFYLLRQPKRTTAQRAQ